MPTPSSDQPRGSRRGKRAAERKPSRWSKVRRLGRSPEPSPGLAMIADLGSKDAPTAEEPAEAPAVPTQPAPTWSAHSEPAAAEPVMAGPELPDETPERVIHSPHGPGKRVIGTWLGIGLIGTALLVVAAWRVGPEWLDNVGSVIVVTVIAWLLAARTAGRAVVAAVIAFALAFAAVMVGGRVLPTGAAVLTAALGGVYAVMATVPAVTYWRAVREVFIATGIAGVTALAAAGFEPTAVTTRFDLGALGIGLVLCCALVYRLGAGFHGLGRRGLLAVTVGAVVLLAMLGYAEMLQRYGTQGMVSTVLDFVETTRDRIGAFPRPLVVLLGLPALIWGVHLRARRRQGWWVSAFGVAATVPLATGLIPPDDTFLEATLRGLYSLALGLPLGWLVIRADLAITGPRGSRARRVEEASAHRPEPERFGEL